MMVKTISKFFTASEVDRFQFCVILFINKQLMKEKTECIVIIKLLKMRIMKKNKS